MRISRIEDLLPMNKRLYRFLVIIAVCLVFHLPPHAHSSLEEDSNLQTACRQQCKRLYRDVYDNGKLKTKRGVYILYDYKNHFNKNLKKCFMLIHEKSYYGSKKTLADVDEDRVYGTIRVSNNKGVTSCMVLDKPCRSEEEWQELIKPYLEE